MRERERKRGAVRSLWGFCYATAGPSLRDTLNAEAVKERHLPSFTRSSSTQGPVSGKTLLPTAAEEEKAELEKAEKQRKPHP